MARGESTARKVRQHGATARALAAVVVELAEAVEKVERLQSIIFELAKAHGVRLPAECA